MQNKEDNIDQLFRNRLENHEVIPPAVIWDGIVSNMEEKKRKRRMFFIWGISSAASLLLAFLGGWYLSNNYSEKQDTFVSTQGDHTPTIENKVNMEPSVSSSEGIKASTVAKNETSSSVHYNSFNEEKDESLSVISKLEVVIMDLLSSGKVSIRSDRAVNYNLIAMNSDDFSESDKMLIEANLRSLEEKKIDKKTGKWSIGVQASPAYRFDQSISSLDLANDAVNKSQLSSSYNTNLTGGVKFEYNSGNRLTFQSGVNYAEVSQTADGVGIAFAGQNWINNRFLVGTTYQDDPTKNFEYGPSSNSVSLNTQIGNANMMLPDGAEVILSTTDNKISPEVQKNYNLDQSAGYIEIPMIVRYKLINSKLGLHVLGGINTNVLVSNNVSLASTNEIIAEGEIEGLNTLTFSSSLGLGLDYAITKRFILTMEPTVKMQLNSLNSQSGFDSRPYTVGIFTGISYNF